MTDVITDTMLFALMAVLKSPKKDVFLKWIHSAGDSIDEKSKQKAYELFECGLINDIEVGTTKGLQQIHAFIFGGLYEFAGQVRTQNISKGGLMFANAAFLPDVLSSIDNMPEGTFAEIVKKYVEMNIAHPFLEGNGRSTRIWLDQMLKRSISRCIDWSRIGKDEYLSAMKVSVNNDTPLLLLLEGALTEAIHDREVFMKGVDYSYYYELGE